MKDPWISAAHPLEFETPYSHIIIYDRKKIIKRKKEPIRVFLQSGAYGSASFLRAEKRNDLVFNYMKVFDRAFSYGSGKDLLLIGGSAYQYPKYVLAHYPDKKITVCEIDPDCIRLAKQYYFLDDCLRQFDPEGKRFTSVIDDGRAYAAGCPDGQFDIVYNDAFASYFPAPRLATKEAAAIMRRILKADGLYIANTLGAPKGRRGQFLRSEYLTIQSVFPYVYVIPVPADYRSRDRYSNHIIIASGNALDIPDAISLVSEPGDLVFADHDKPGVRITEMVMGHYHSG